MRLDARTYANDSAGGTATASAPGGTATAPGGPAKRPPAVPFNPPPAPRPGVAPAKAPAAPQPAAPVASVAPEIKPATGEVYDLPTQPADDQAIISGLLILDEYRALGVEPVGGVGQNHWVHCRFQENICAVNAKTGHFRRFPDLLDFFTFAAQYGSFIDRAAARRYFVGRAEQRTAAASVPAPAAPFTPDDSPIPAEVPPPVAVVSLPNGQNAWQCANCDTWNPVGSECVRCAEPKDVIEPPAVAGPVSGREAEYISLVRKMGQMLRTEINRLKNADNHFSFARAVVIVADVAEELCDTIDYEESPETAPTPEQREQIAAADPYGKPLIEATLEDIGLPEGIIKLLRAGGIETYGQIHCQASNGDDWHALTKIKGIGRGKVDLIRKACDEHVAERRKRLG